MNALDVITKYAVDETINNDAYAVVKYFLTQGRTGEIKEEIVASVLGYVHANENIHGCDAYNNKRPVEIKCETPEKHAGLAGKAAWGSTNYIKKLQKLEDMDQEFVLAGFTNEGRLIYILSVDLNKTLVIEKLKHQILNWNSTGNKTPKTTHKQLHNDGKNDFGVEMKYFNYKHFRSVKVNGKFEKFLIHLAAMGDFVQHGHGFFS